MKPSAFEHRNLPSLMLHAREVVMATIRPSLREQGISEQQWRVLRVLDEHGAVDIGRIARDSLILGPSLTGVLARMERDALLTRERDPDDLRRTRVQATPEGLRQVQAMALRVDGHYRDIANRLGEDRLQQLYRLLDAVIALDTSVPPVADGGEG